MGWRTIYIEEGHKVSLYLNNLKIEDSDETYIVPISDIDTVIFNNLNYLLQYSCYASYLKIMCV